jgi:hypothetical protein
MVISYRCVSFCYQRLLGTLPMPFPPLFRLVMVTHLLVSIQSPHQLSLAVAGTSEVQTAQEAASTLSCRNDANGDESCYHDEGYDDGHGEDAGDGSDLGEPQDLEGGREYDISMEDIKQHIVEARTYIETEARSTLDPEIVESCKNKDKDCALWR